MPYLSNRTKEREEPITLGPLDNSIVSPHEGVAVQECGDSNVAEQWVNGHNAMGEAHRTNRRNPENFAFLVEEVREHNQEAHHLAKLGTEGKR